MKPAHPLAAIDMIAIKGYVEGSLNQSFEKFFLGTATEVLCARVATTTLEKKL
jgi:hypothetical protein